MPKNTAKQEPFKASSFFDSVGRRRKLSAGSMTAICNEYAAGKTIRELAASYGVSTSLIRTVVYHTARNSDLARIELSES
ncbi:helix-turn-helix DNA binding domain protein [Arthrobacter phage EastWest]|uniref:Helix-turn-helix DNA binding domain protein n=1 Tax=Arthrobacter phage EastWest TaxID=2894292 RepID=A0AAE9C9N2_9CAUD|nr:helix-turn-helix DNA binding domain protein [Arthrobacter phage EastWest]